jgi:hypothetical protein
LAADEAVKQKIYKGLLEGLVRERIRKMRRRRRVKKKKIK